MLGNAGPKAPVYRPPADQPTMLRMVPVGARAYRHHFSESQYGPNSLAITPLGVTLSFVYWPNSLAKTPLGVTLSFFRLLAE